MSGEGREGILVQARSKELRGLDKVNFTVRTLETSRPGQNGGPTCPESSLRVGVGQAVGVVRTRIENDEAGVTLQQIGVRAVVGHHAGIWRDGWPDDTSSAPAPVAARGAAVRGNWAK